MGEESEKKMKEMLHPSLRSVLLLMPSGWPCAAAQVVDCISALCQKGKEAELETAFSSLSHVPWCGADSAGRKEKQFFKLYRNIMKQ